MNINHICMKCMTGKINEDGKCLNCGAINATEKNGSIHLPVRTILKGKYLVGRVIGEGGFGITYIGYDLDLEIRVAIKEFCPKQSVGREAEDGLTLYPYNESAAENFSREKEKFINEARRLAKFRNEGGVVSVMDYFVENGTAYIVMDYIDGITLKSYLKTLRDTTGKTMSMEGVLNLFKPVMETLAKIHESGIIHRDISPENIMISKDLKKVYLIDFGTARDVESGHTLSEYSKSFYTPIEQRSEKMKQGPWTDVYALCATIYVCITGRKLTESVSRLIEDDIIMPSKFGVEVSPSVEKVLMKGLAVKPEDRIQSMEELMQALYFKKNMAEQEPQKEPVNVNVATKIPGAVAKNVAQVAVNSRQTTYSRKGELDYAKQILKDDVEKVNNIELTFRVISIITIIVSAVWIILDGLTLFPIVLLIIIVIGAKYCGDSVVAKKKYIFLDFQPNIGKVLFQIELMKCFFVFYEKNAVGGLRRRYEVNYDDYRANYLAHKHEINHPCHQFWESQEVDVKFFRYELIDYYHKTILPSDIPEELKVEWKQAAIDSWVIIED